VWRESALQKSTTMSSSPALILPGESVTVAHPNLKLGPGLAQDSSTRDRIVVTRAGTLNHSANGAKWWVEGNSRRVRLLTIIYRLLLTDTNGGSMCRQHKSP
jgi:hypothetical protein